MGEMLYDIAEVCKELGITSRTLRFYEEKGIITSEKTDFSLRRRYTEKQVEHIRYVLVLRTLGLSVKAIKEIQAREIDLKKAILSRRAEILASIYTKQRELVLLNDALARIETGNDIFETQKLTETETDEISRFCAEAIVYGNLDVLYRYVTPKLADYMPKSAFEAIHADSIAPLGVFVEIERMERDRTLSNVMYCYAKYEKLGMRIKLVFHGEKIDGLWLSYYENGKEKRI